MKRFFMFSMRGISLVLVTLIFCTLSGYLSAAPPGSCIPWPECKDDGGGDPPETPDTLAGWIGNFIYEDGRNCHLGDMHPDGASGHYKCSMSEDQAIDFHLPSGFVPIKGEPELCAYLSDWSMAPNTNYAYAWGDSDCVPGYEDSCEIHILNWFYENHEIPGVGLINLDAYGMVQNVDFESNPFANDQMVEVHEINVSMKALGKNRPIAVCRWTFGDEEVFFQSVVP